jgi:hypothetical protein
MHWAEFEAQAPEIGAAGRRLLFHLGFGLGYLATIRRDGSPRLHPINVCIVDGRLLAFLVPSPKLADLRRDPRYALHATGSESVDDELEIGGRATFPDDAGLRAEAATAVGFTVPDDHVLVELGVDRVLWGHYERPGAFPPTYRRWAGKPASSPS